MSLVALGETRRARQQESRAHLLPRLRGHAAEFGCTVRFEPTSGHDGYCDRAKRAIVVNSELAAIGRPRVLIHELCHSHDTCLATALAGFDGVADRRYCERDVFRWDAGASGDGDVTFDDGLSNRAIDRAGALLRELRSATAAAPLDPVEVDTALLILETFRSRFTSSQVLARVRIGVEHYARQTVPGTRAVQRTKKTDRIIGKLVRQPSLKLSRLEDVAGCRIVVPTLPQQYEIVERLRRAWGDSVTRHRDYVSEPKATGYRAHHLIVRRDSLPVEVQVRTDYQHRWARTVEAEEIRRGTLLKDGEGDAEVLATFRAIAQVGAEFDAGLIASEAEFNRRFSDILRGEA